MFMMCENEGVKMGLYRGGGGLGFGYGRVCLGGKVF